MNSKKIVSIIGAAVVAASMALSSLPVCAAVTTMPDGGKFDAAYYAATYPDVVAALGTDANALYQHYKTFGAKEGRLPYAAGTASTASTTATTATSQPVSLTASEKKNARKVLNEFLSGNNAFYLQVNEEDYSIGGKVPGTVPAPNPAYAVADLNSDGIKELYVTPDASTSWQIMHLYLLSGTSMTQMAVNYNGYSPALIYYMSDYGYSFEIDESGWPPVTGMIMGMDNYDGTWFVNYDSAARKFFPANANLRGGAGDVSAASINSIKAYFVDLTSVLTFTPLTQANVNAIK